MLDFPATVSTTATIAVGGVFESVLGSPGDRDWVRVTLTAGEAVLINLDGIGSNALEDPFVRIRDADGTVLAENDDSPFGQNSELEFTAATSGTYFIEVDAYRYTDPLEYYLRDGDYRLTVRLLDDVPITPPVPEVTGPLASIAWGAAQPDPVVTVYFAPRGETFDGFTSDGFNAYEQGQILAALAEIAAVTNLEFVTVSTAANADFRMVLDTNEVGNLPDDEQFLGYFTPPGEAEAGVGVFNGALWDRRAGGDLDRGGYGYVTLTHEVLHGLGLAHPHDDGGTSTIMAGVTEPYDDLGRFDLNQGVYTTMSYNSGYLTGVPGSAPQDLSRGDFGFEGGPMALDIAYLQAVYGANMAHATGNNRYVLDDSNGPGTYWEAIWDAGGYDALRYDGRKDAILDLRAATLQTEHGGGGFVSSAAGIAGGFTIANGVVIEAAKGGFGDDTIRGNDVNNRLAGRGGDDRIFGASGNDIIKGNTGNDTLFGENNDDRLRGGYGRDHLIGGEGDDYLRGDAAADRLFGGSGADQLVGNGGADILGGGTGADILTGGRGRDTFEFRTTDESAAGFANRDQITDFDTRRDQIDVSRLDADTARGGNQEFSFIGRSGFSDAGQLRATSVAGGVLVAGDTDGDGRADFELLVLLDGGRLQANDFIL